MDSIFSVNSLFCAGRQLPPAFFPRSAMLGTNPAEKTSSSTPSIGASGGAPATNVVTKPESKVYPATVKKVVKFAAGMAASDGNVCEMEPQASSSGAAVAGPSIAKGQFKVMDNLDLADELEVRFGRAMELNSPMKRVGHVFDLHSMIQDVSDSDDDEFSDSSSEEERGGLATIVEEDEEEEEEAMF